MTGGHVWRIFGSFILVHAGECLILGLLFVPVTLTEQGQSDIVVIAMTLLGVVFSLFLGMIMMPLLPAWYENFHQRHETSHSSEQTVSVIG